MTEVRGTSQGSATAGSDVLDALPLVVLGFDEAGVCVWGNRTARELLEGEALSDEERLASAVALPAGSSAGLATMRLVTARGVIERSALLAPAPAGSGATTLAVCLAGEETLGLEGIAGEVESRLEALLQHTTDIITVLEPNGTIRYTNQATVRLLGLSGESVNGRSAFDLLHPDDTERVATALVDQLATPGVAPPIELRLRFADGEWHDMEAVAANLIEDPAVRGLVITLHDVTERRRNAEELARSEERFRALVANLTDVIVLLDAEAQVIYASPSIAYMIGAAPDTNLGMSAFNDIHPDDLELVMGTAGSAMERPDELLGTSFRIWHNHRGWRQIDATIVNRLGDPEVAGIVCVLRDVTDQRAAEEELHAAHARELATIERLRELDHLKDEFVTTVSHELRTPLTSILGFSDLLLQIAPPDWDEHGLLARIKANAEEMAGMVEQILDFSRLQAGEVRIALDRVLLDEVVTRTLEVMATVLARHTVELELEPGLVVLADADATVVVLRNLLGNAAKFAAAGTTIRVRTWAEDREAVLTVGDEGPGIPTEEREHIFDRFWQGEYQVPGRRGTGVGLSIVRRYVELQDGHTWVVPSVGPGTTIAFTLPLARR